MNNPFKRIKRLEAINQELSLKISRLNLENSRLKLEIEKLREKVGNPAEVIKKVLGRPLKWKEFDKMNDAQKRQYYLEAKAVLENETFNSELNAIIVDCINSAAKETVDFQQVLNRRFTINGVLLLKERLEGISLVEKEEPSEEELIEAI